MTALAKGQNIPLPVYRLAIRIEPAGELDVSALLLGADERVASSDDFVFYNQPRAGGAQLAAGALQVDLDALPPTIAVVRCLLSVDPGAPALGELVAPVVRVSAADGGPVASFELAGLAGERAVTAVELYRREGRWKLRAVGQGYAAGLPALLTAHGVEVDDPADAASETGPVTAPAVGAPAGIAVQPRERLFGQVWSIFEDAARSTVALRSATEYAEQRLDRELSEQLADPAARNSPAGQSARAAVERRHEELMRWARGDHQRDVAHLAAELAAVAPALPAPMAAWNSAAWLHPASAERAPGIRVGELHVDEAPQLRIPFLVGLPVRRPLWIDTAGAAAGEAEAIIRGLVARLIAAQPPGTLHVHIADLVGPGRAVAALATLGPELIAPPATDPATLSQTLNALVERVDLVQLAAQAGALDSLDGGDHLLVLQDFPYGFDDAALARVRYLLDEGPRAGVTLLVVADGGEAEGRGPLVSSLFRDFLRLATVPDDRLGDPWVGVAWTFTPDVDADAQVVVERVLAQLAAAVSIKP